jgi:hypothetical protein
MAKFHADKVSRLALKGVSSQLGGWLDEMTVGKFQEASAEPSPPPPFSGINETAPTGGPLSAKRKRRRPPFELGETFSVFTLSLDRIEEGQRTGVDLFYLAQDTGRYHHQLAYHGQPAGFARTTSENAAGMDVCQLYVSALAKHIDDAINWLDEFEKKDQAYAAFNPLVRLLFIPSYQTHVFWLIRDPKGLVRRLASRARGAGGTSRKQPQVTSDVLIIDAPSYLSPLGPLTMLSSRDLLDALREKQPLGGGLFFSPQTSGQ